MNSFGITTHVAGLTKLTSQCSANDSQNMKVPVQMST